MASSREVPWDAVAYVQSSQNRSDVLKILAEQPQTASDVAEQLPMSRQSVSVAIGHMREQSDMGEKYDIVECLTPDRANYRIYGLTDDGEKIAECLSE
jgi:Mn-dependent DtxR family transcriptional regulator